MYDTPTNQGGKTELSLKCENGRQGGRGEGQWGGVKSKHMNNFSIRDWGKYVLECF